VIVLVAGALANKCGNGGNAWTRLSWTRGLDALGIDAYFVERLDGPYPAEAIGFFEAVMEEFGDPARAALLGADDQVLAGGMTYEELLEAAAGCELLVNLSGHLPPGELRRRVSRCVFVDDDPGYTQFWHATGMTRGRLEGHDAHYTFGTRIGTAGSPVPTCGVRWRGIRPPVVLADWPPVASAECRRVTTIASLRGPFGPVEHKGVRYGQKVHELRSFSELPRLAGRELEIALAVDPLDEADARRLRRDGWTLVDPASAASDPASFRRYVQGSDAELSVAQAIYAQTACGWFSDRSTRYLASGSPVIVQDTGFSAELPVGSGLLAFRTPREAAAALNEVERSYDVHARAARAIAEEYFDSARVIGGLLEDVL
jgi:hypothetical protein